MGSHATKAENSQPSGPINTLEDIQLVRKLESAYRNGKI